MITATKLLWEVSLLYGDNRLAMNNDLQKAVSDIKEAITASHGQPLPALGRTSYVAAARCGLEGPSNQAMLQKQKMIG